MNMKIYINPFTLINNYATDGNFTYFINSPTNCIINLKPNQINNNHLILFNYTIFDIDFITTNQNSTTFHFIEKQKTQNNNYNLEQEKMITIFGTKNNSINYLLIDKTKIIVSTNYSYIYIILRI